MNGQPRRHALVPWVGLYGGAWDLWSPESMSHPAKGSPGLFFRILAHLEELGLLRPGDVVLDPMAGVGSTLLCASLLGFDSVGVELEPRWAGLARANIARLRGARGTATVVQGDARRLPELLAASGYVAVTSPPFLESGQVAEKPLEWWITQARNRDVKYRHLGEADIIRQATFDKRRHDAMRYGTSPAQIGNLKDKGLIGITSPPYADSDNRGREDKTTEGWSNDGRRRGGPINRQDYGAAPGQIGALPDRGMIGVTSPPYEDALGTDQRAGRKVFGGQFNSAPMGETDGQIANLDYASAMLQVYQGLAQVCKVLAVVTKNPTRDGKLRRLDRDTARLLRLAGWQIVDYHRAVLFEEREQQDLFGATQRKVKGRMSFFKRLSYNRGSPVAQWEDCLFAVRSPSPMLPGGADA